MGEVRAVVASGLMLQTRRELRVARRGSGNVLYLQQSDAPLNVPFGKVTELAVHLKCVHFLYLTVFIKQQAENRKQ